ncbi:MAG: hypothetical protein HOB51_08280 [Thaumarchaeota archaeon]|mgnify:FL=1|jgi:hypothetical protein|nr:hypothetical protein [Candidatus Nitrosopelagicus sp.]MBT6647492.1 hypothetical protein [Nitrososphaerota archaeon]MBT7253012.1 hypothetical protein [Candidatus Nitrosopelagicus sp.]|tara:strand:- start:1150 stop:1983 length:834 start_codon:yes stop_codon:yes gene_type:complete
MLKQFFKSKNKLQTPTIGANIHIVSQLQSLQIEKDILTKTIARLYQNESDLTKIQKDRLLLRYQHQLGVIITRIEKLENASKHPDLGPLGDGLITLMDQKLSQLDQRLYELTSKIEVAQTQNNVQIKKNNKNSNGIENKEEKSKAVFEKPIVEFVNRSSKKFEITTLTSLPKLDPVKQSKYDQMLSQLSSDVITPPPMKPKMQESQKIETPEIKEQSVIPVTKDEPEHVVKPVLNEMPKPIVELPEESEIDDEDDDIEQIKSKILKTLSKIEQAEVD